ncbi:type IX secretion system membrane protein PorP/SprF [Gillisia sp. M10.2A]|uniref:Type IX secretion system membrane protein PorP/SprF n=1 Tax=Gillisia lutea TaxID=2909668 RepID=A0ABS9EB87_9FLAO|nr:type IX secretion system membrane protein PorP/SprF [Gillisia lutea]MCF4100152.1 type IX secretion system membrane protein PorP/SprF [Gillisia lutea]
MRVGVIGILLLGLLNSFSSNAQEVIPTYSDYLTDNLYLLHPSMAGAANFNKIRITARQQWFDVEDAPSLQTLSVNARMGEKIGLGVIMFNDQNGNYSKRGLYGTFAYHLLLSRSELDLNQFSFGVSAGIIQHSLDESGFTGFDPVINGDDVTDYYGNIDLGMSYYYLDFFAHITAKNILSVNRELFYSDAVPSNQRKYLFSTGYTIHKLKSSYSFEPSVMFQLREQTGEKSIDANIKVYKNMELGDLWGGLSYRRSFEGAEYTTDGTEIKNQKLQYLTPFVGFEYNKFLFAYTYSYQMNSLVLSNSGFHQITLGYNFGENRERYECECPAIN